MPITITGSSGLGGAGRDLGSLQDKDYGYVYPGDLDLRPSSDLHKKLVSEIMKRAQAARSVVSDKYDSWQKIDDMMNAYIPLDELEQKEKDADERTPIQICVPVAYAARETLLTYMSAAFMNGPIFNYAPVGPEDTSKAVKLTALIEHQVTQGKAALELFTHWKDDLTYGLGVAHPAWEVRKAKRTIRRTEEGIDPVTMLPTSTKWKEKVERVIFEGNVLHAIDPYMYLPDPNVPADKVQRGEFVGWLRRDNRMNLLADEQTDKQMFNAKYLKHFDGRSVLFNEGGSQRSDLTRSGDNYDSYTHPVDCVYMYLKIIPKEWKLSEKNVPEKWLFVVAGDTLLLKAAPLNMDHDMFPVGVCSSNYDGRSVIPLSRMETIYGMQELLNWMYNSHITNVRKSINDMLVYDPQAISTKDITNRKPGKLIRTRKPFWGRGVKDAIMQLNVSDVTQAHVSDAIMMADSINQYSGATDPLRGMFRKTSERVSATEVSQAQKSSMSRLETIARIVYMQSHHDLAYMFASQTQQLMERDTSLRVLGDLAEQLGMETDKPVPVSMEDISLDYDVVPHDGTIPGNEDPQIWAQVLQTVSSSEQLTGELDVVRLFRHLARQMGAKNINDFIKRRPVQANVMQPEQIEQGVQDGNLVPLQ